jgi:hypothetical protein
MVVSALCDIEIDAFYLNNKDENGKTTNSCFLEPFLADRMMNHQKEGVKFMFGCITGLKGPGITGCILAVAKPPLLK